MGFEPHLALTPSGAKSAGTASGILWSRCTSNRFFRYSSALNHVSEQNSRYFRRCDGSRLIAAKLQLTRPCESVFERTREHQRGYDASSLSPSW